MSASSASTSAVVRGAGRPAGRSAAAAGSWRPRAASPGRPPTTAARRPCEHTRPAAGRRCGPGDPGARQGRSWADHRTAGGGPVAEERSWADPVGGRATGGRAPPPGRWRTRGRVGWAFWLAIVVVFPVAVAAVPAPLPPRRADPGHRPGAARRQPRLDPRPAGLRPAGLRLRPGAALPGQGVGLQGASAARCCARAGQIPVARFTADAHERARRGAGRLAAGNVVVIYPEGTVTRDPDWWPMEARTGRRPAGPDHRRRRRSRSPSGGRSSCTTTTAKKLHLRLRTPADYLVGEPVDLSAQRAGCGPGDRSPRSCCGRRPT